ncbi:MAG: hypothetical protein ACYTEU_06570 [Planctomycetota bacterium]|jgi:hypothetical protein
MIQTLVGVGIAYLFFKNKNKDDAVVDDDTMPDDTTPTPQKWTDTSEWSGEYFAMGEGGENVVWFYRSGIRYEDGTTEWSNTQYIVIGDKNHHNFLRSNSDRGTIDIKWEYTGNPSKQDSKNVIVFPTLEDAQKRADELSNPEEDDDPTSPQKPDEPEDDEPSQPSFPTQPSFPSFGGESSYGF